MTPGVIVLPRRATFNQWAYERKEHRLHMVSASFDERGNLTCVIESENGRRIMFEDETGNQSIRQPVNQENRKTAQDRKGRLGKLLAELVKKAEQTPGTVQRMTLPGGLRVDTIVGLDGMSRVMLGRHGVKPSDTEWVTTLNHWPYDPPLEADPERFEHNGWNCMRAAWKTPGGE